MSWTGTDWGTSPGPPGGLISKVSHVEPSGSPIVPSEVPWHRWTSAHNIKLLGSARLLAAANHMLKPWRIGTDKMLTGKDRWEALMVLLGHLPPGCPCLPCPYVPLGCPLLPWAPTPRQDINKKWLWAKTARENGRKTGSSLKGCFRQIIQTNNVMQSRKRTIPMENLSWACSSIQAADTNTWMNIEKTYNRQ